MKSTVFSNFLFLLVLPASALRLATAPTSFGEKSTQNIKIVVASHKNYGDVRWKFYQSLKAAGFKRYEDIIMVIAGDDEHSYKDLNTVAVMFDGKGQKRSEPILYSIAQGGWDTYEKFSDKITFVHTPFNNFDLTAWSAIANNYYHPNIHASGFLFLHDTVKIQDTFPDLFNSLTVEFNQIKMPPRPNNNIMLVGASVMKEMADKHNFDTLLSKDDGVCIDGGLQANGVKPPELFAQQVTVLEPRVRNGQSDTYHAGTDRLVYDYAAFGLSKFQLESAHGDITGDIKPLGQANCEDFTPDDGFDIVKNMGAP